MKSLTLATSTLFALTGCAADLGAPDPSSETDTVHQQLFAQVSEEGDSLTFQSLESLIAPTERAFVRYGDSRVPVETAEALAESEDGFESLVVTYSFVPVDGQLEVALAEASSMLTIEVDGSQGTSTVAELNLDLDASLMAEGTSQEALSHCSNGREFRRASNTSFVGYQFSRGSWLCHYRGLGEYPGGKRYRYTCSRCRP